MTSPPLAPAASDDRSGSQTSERIAALERRIAVGDAASKQTQDALWEALKEKDRMLTEPSPRLSKSSLI